MNRRKSHSPTFNQNTIQNVIFATLIIEQFRFKDSRKNTSTVSNFSVYRNIYHIMVKNIKDGIDIYKTQKIISDDRRNRFKLCVKISLYIRELICVYNIW